MYTLTRRFVLARSSEDFDSETVPSQTVADLSERRVVVAGMIENLPETIIEVSLTQSESREWSSVLAAVAKLPNLRTLKLDHKA